MEHYRYLTADNVHNGYQFLDDAVIKVEANGRIVAVLSEAECAGEHVERFAGILCPGFVNVHCHLELSHLFGQIAEDTGLVGFVKQIPTTRDKFTTEDKIQAAQNAMQQMYDNGIVAVGDISNTAETLELKQSFPMHTVTFVEAMGFVPQGAPARFAYSKGVLDQFRLANNTQDYTMEAYVVPHAPYSVCTDLFQLINAEDEDSIVSMHNQESAAELQYFKDKTGDVTKLFSFLGINDNYFEPKNEISVAYALKNFGAQHPVILVHNTFTDVASIAYLKELEHAVYFCLCPNANWFIERTLPNIPLLMESGFPICLGTDSLASNYQLNIYEEVKRIQAHFSYIPLEDMLTWATSNGAKALGLSELIGTFECGKTPGINLIKGSDLERVM